MMEEKFGTRTPLRRVGAVVGIGETDWVQDWHRVRAGEHPADSYGYAAEAFRRALADAGLTRGDIDGFITGPTTATERMGEILGINPRWSTQADAFNSVQQACMAIASGMAEVIALVYGNDQRSAGTRYGGQAPMGGDLFLAYTYHAPWGLTSQGALYALTHQRYMYETGASEADLGRVAVATRDWAALNPAAIMRKRITLEDYLASSYICEPLRLFDYCLINDGGVALIIMEGSRAKRMSNHPVFIEAIGRSDLNTKATSLQPRLEGFYYAAQQACAEQMFSTAAIGPEDVDMLQVYDSFSTHVPLALEGYGYCARGDAARFLRDEGIGPGKRLPVNTSGGHLSESYMQGWNHQLEAVKQLRQHAGVRQIEGCRYVHYASDIAGKCGSVLYSR
jgi:acetyl-CoA acetyltransferase